MKQELEAEYLATFKKTVAMHETFLTRLAAHPTFRTDRNLQIFLEYEKELSVRGKNKREKIAGFFGSLQKTTDELLLSNTMKEVRERKFYGLILEVFVVIAWKCLGSMKSNIVQVKQVQRKFV